MPAPYAEEYPSLYYYRMTSGLREEGLVERNLENIHHMFLSQKIISIMSLESLTKIPFSCLQSSVGRQILMTKCANENPVDLLSGSSIISGAL